MHSDRCFFFFFLKLVSAKPSSPIRADPAEQISPFYAGLLSPIKPAHINDRHPIPLTVSVVTGRREIIYGNSCWSAAGRAFYCWRMQPHTCMDVSPHSLIRKSHLNHGAAPTARRADRPGGGSPLPFSISQCVTNEKEEPGTHAFMKIQTHFTPSELSARWTLLVFLHVWKETVFPTAAQIHNKDAALL